MPKPRGADATTATSARPATLPRRRPGRPLGGGVVADRAQLLEAAERLIRAEGPDVTMAAMAAEAQVSKPILYRGVGDRDELVAALAEQFVDRINDGVSAAVAGATGPRDGLRRFVGAYLEVIEDNRNLYLFVTAGASGDDRVNQALHLADRSARPLADRLAARRTSVGADPSVALTWSYGLIGMLHFVTLWWMREPTLDSGALADHITELLWSGLRGETPDQPDGRRPRRQGVTTP